MVHVVALKSSHSSVSSVICWLAWVVVAVGTGSGMFTGELLAGAGTVFGRAITDSSFIISCCCPTSCCRSFSLVDDLSACNNYILKNFLNIIVAIN